MGSNPLLQQQLIGLYHSTPVRGHSDAQATIKHMPALLYWKGMNKLVREFVRNCTICLQHKTETMATPVLFQPLPNPGPAFK